MNDADHWCETGFDVARTTQKQPAPMEFVAAFPHVQLHLRCCKDSRASEGLERAHRCRKRSLPSASDETNLPTSSYAMKYL